MRVWRKKRHEHTPLGRGGKRGRQVERKGGSATTHLEDSSGKEGARFRAPNPRERGDRTRGGDFDEKKIWLHNRGGVSGQRKKGAIDF